MHARHKQLTTILLFPRTWHEEGLILPVAPRDHLVCSETEVGRAWTSMRCGAECRMFVSKRGGMESLCSEDMRYMFSALVCAGGCVLVEACTSVEITN